MAWRVPGWFLLRSYIISREKVSSDTIFKGIMISVTLFGAYASNMVSIKFSFTFSIIFSIIGCWNPY